MKRFSFLSVMLVGALAISPAFAQGSDAPVRGSKVKGTPSEIEYNPRFGTMITSGAEKEYITSVIYNYQTGEISLGGEFDPRTGKRLAATPQAAGMPQDETVSMRGTKVKGTAEEIQYNPRFGTQMVSAAEREYVTGLIYNPVSQEIFLGGNYDPRDGKPLRQPPATASSHRPDHVTTQEYVPPPTRGMHWN
jgi:hypothetical protein